MARTKQTARKYSPEFINFAEKQTGKKWENISEKERKDLLIDFNKKGENPPRKEKKEKKEPRRQKKLPDTKLFDRFLEVQQIEKAAANDMNRAELISDFKEWKISMAERRKTFPPGFLSWVTKEHQISRVKYIQMYTAETDKEFIRKFLEMKKGKEELVKLKEEKAEIVRPTVPLVKVDSKSNLKLESWSEKGINVHRGTRGSNEYVVFRGKKLYGPFF